MLLQKRFHLIVTSQMQQSMLTFYFILKSRKISSKIVQNRAAKVKMIQKRASQGFLDPIQKRALSRSVQLEAVYLEALLYTYVSIVPTT